MSSHEFLDFRFFGFEEIGGSCLGSLLYGLSEPCFRKLLSGRSLVVPSLTAVITLRGIEAHTLTPDPSEGFRVYGLGFRVTLQTFIADPQEESRKPHAYVEVFVTLHVRAAR